MMARSQNALVLTHGAGGNADSPLLIAVANGFAAAGYEVVRYNLPFRLKKRFGPPHPARAAEDREGLRQAVEEMRVTVSGQVFLGGHSYGGRQSTMLAAEEPGLVDGLLLLSYPLHPPQKPAQLRTAHFPNLRTPALFVHGTNDPFGAPAELAQALQNMPAPFHLIEIDGAGHDLRRGKFDIPGLICAPFEKLIGADPA